MNIEDMLESCNYGRFSLTSNGYIKIFDNLKEINYVGSEEVSVDYEIIELLLKKYKKLYLYTKAIELFHNIPKYITHLIIDFNDFKDISLDKLHDGLESLIIINSYPYDEAFNIKIDNLPHTLKSLYIYVPYFDQPINLLPMSLIDLTIYSNYFNQSLDNLPPSLKYFKIDRCDTYGLYKSLSNNFMNLPEGLKHLTITNHIIQCHDEKEKEEFLFIIRSRYPDLDVALY